jgi:hypothetical protein
MGMCDVISILLIITIVIARDQYEQCLLTYAGPQHILHNQALVALAEPPVPDPRTLVSRVAACSPRGFGPSNGLRMRAPALCTLMQEAMDGLRPAHAQRGREKAAAESRR